MAFTVFCHPYSHFSMNGTHFVVYPFLFGGGIRQVSLLEKLYFVFAYPCSGGVMYTTSKFLRSTVCLCLLSEITDSVLSLMSVDQVVMRYQLTSLSSLWPLTGVRSALLTTDIIVSCAAVTARITI